MEFDGSGNVLLNLVIRADKVAGAALLRGAQLLDVECGQSLQADGDGVTSCYFPASGVLSLTLQLDPDTRVNTLTLGFDGAAFASVGSNLSHATQHAIARVPGHVWQVDAADWHALIDSNREVRRVVTSFTGFWLHRAHQLLACEMHHDVECRVCRSLVELHRWQQGGPVEMTHQGLSDLLGVRRTTVTLIARSLQDAGIISYRKGLIEISDPYALRQASCPCHEMPRHEWGELCKVAAAGLV